MDIASQPLLLPPLTCEQAHHPCRLLALTLTLSPFPGLQPQGLELVCPTCAKRWPLFAGQTEHGCLPWMLPAALWKTVAASRSQGSILIPRVLVQPCSRASLLVFRGAGPPQRQVLLGAAKPVTVLKIGSALNTGGTEARVIAVCPRGTKFLLQTPGFLASNSVFPPHSTLGAGQGLTWASYRLPGRLPVEVWPAAEPELCTALSLWGKGLAEKTG